MKNILVTGGMGYIGSHTCVELIKENFEPIIVDDLSNSKIDVLDKLEKITGKRPKFYKASILDAEALDKIFTENAIDAVIHFAGFKAVGESVAKPLEYYHNNITGTLILCDAMKKHNCKNIVFSSSATVYKSTNPLPFAEDMELAATNPYGRTKLMIETILGDLYTSDNEWNITLLRYFNPIGAHESGLIGENPNGIPNNLMPYIVRVASGKYPHLSVFGNDYPTPDGTGVRDYIHVVDLAKGHIKALSHLSGLGIYNLGTGNGYSVLDIVRAFEGSTGVKVPYVITERRPGDVAFSYANAEKAARELGWKAELGIEDMCRSSWNYLVKNKEN